MKILKVSRTDVSVRFRHEVQASVTEPEERDITAHEAPMPSFDKSLQDLAKVAASVLGCPKDWADTIKVQALAISYTKAGTKAAQIIFSKDMEKTASFHKMKTQFFQIDDPQDGEETEKQCTKAEAKAVETMIDEAVKYAEGERQQILLPLESGEPAEPAEGETLEFEAAAK